MSGFTVTGYVLLVQDGILVLEKNAGTAVCAWNAAGGLFWDCL